MNVGESTRKAIDDWSQGDVEAAMLHACNAVDGTSKKAYARRLTNKGRFTRLLRDNYNILGPMALPNIDVEKTRFPVIVSGETGRVAYLDFADVIYRVHRCSHGHGDELPAGFELLNDAAGPQGRTRLVWDEGKVQLSDRVIFGLLAVAVLSSVNSDQRVPDEYFLTFGVNDLPINEWWGRSNEFIRLVEQEQLIAVNLDFREWPDRT